MVEKMGNPNVASPHPPPKKKKQWSCEKVTMGHFLRNPQQTPAGLELKPCIFTVATLTTGTHLSTVTWIYSEELEAFLFGEIFRFLGISSCELFCVFFLGGGRGEIIFRSVGCG